MININYSLSVRCYKCLNCPDPFDPTSPSVYNKSGCNWCSKLKIPGLSVPLRQCSPDCSYEYFGETYPELTYYCCQTDYCNESVQTCVTHQILLITLITLICIFIIKKK
ncbi:unnamed protein product [Schistosoma turkestanicum]|nr:unnamed protein product [Schistosoma turkestanicum]